MLNVKQETCKYQLLKTVGLTHRDGGEDTTFEAKASKDSEKVAILQTVLYTFRSSRENLVILLVVGDITVFLSKKICVTKKQGVRPFPIAL